jgi:thiol-disulfide isomerase/thioredoxin
MAFQRTFLTIATNRAAPRFTLACVVAVSLLLSACEKPKPTHPALGPNGQLAEGWAVSDQDFSPALKKKFGDHIDANNGTLDLKKMPDDLRAAVLAGAVEAERVPLASLPPELAKLAFAIHLKAPETGSPLSGLVNDGSTQRDLAGLRSDYYLISVWATWCAPCIAELKDFGTLARTIGPDRLKVVAIQSEAKSEGLLKKTAEILEKAGDFSGVAMWRDASASGKAIADNAGSLPLTLLIGPDGKEIGRVTGAPIAEGGTIWASEDARAFMIALTNLRSSNQTPSKGNP